VMRAFVKGEVDLLWNQRSMANLSLRVVARGLGGVHFSAPRRLLIQSRRSSAARVSIPPAPV
jgi:hypothetical protein